MIKEKVGANLVEKFPSVPKTDVSTVTPYPNVKTLLYFHKPCRVFLIKTYY